jgi:protein TonB
MKQKKTGKADLEKKRLLFFQFGLAISLSLVLIAFEWPSAEIKNQLHLNSDDYVFEEEMTDITYLEKKMKPEFRPPDVYKIEIVNDDEIIEEEIIIDVETNIWETINYFNTNFDDEVEETIPFFRVEEKPGFRNGGVDEFRRYVVENVIYPREAVSMSLCGKVFVEFTVNEKGKVTNVRLLRGVDPMLDIEALRVIQSSPLWTPGRQRGKPVKVTFTIPVNFELQ